MARVKHVLKKSITIREETRRRRARFTSIGQDKKILGCKEENHCTKNHSKELESNGNQGG